MRRLLVSLALLVTITPQLAAQHLRDQLSDLFIFGAGQDPLFLGGTGDPNNPESVRIHGNHFVPAAVASNGTVISFLTNTIGSNVANVPVSATSGGSTATATASRRPGRGGGGTRRPARRARPRA